MKRIAFLFCIVLFSTQLLAQRPKLMIEGVSPNLYLTHKVAAGESLTGIAKLYNQTASRVATFNAMSNTASLNGKTSIKIPLDNNNFEQKGQKLNDEVLIPLYHMIGQGETLYRISINHYKVPINYLKEWNNMNKDAIWPGTTFIVGYLRVKQNLVPALYGEAVTQFDETGDTKPEVKLEEPKPDTPKQPVVTKPAEPEVKKDEKPKTPGTAVLKTGFYTNQFPKDDGSKTSVELSGDAAIFKTTSGWQDKRFYALMNDVTPGTIIKISTTDDKIIYAKVLGALPSMKENNGLFLRISNAAAAELGISDAKFALSVQYYR